MNTKDNDGWTALVLAAKWGSLDTVRTLLAGGADINARANNGAPALSVAEEQKYSDVVALLKSAGAVRQSTSGRLTPG